MLSDLAGKRVLVTGSSSGIGAGIAGKLAAAGARVAVHCHSNAERAEALVADLNRGEQGGAVLVKGDLSRSAEAERVVDEAAGQLGGLDILINNAGSLVRRVPLAEIDDAYFDDVLNLNVRSYVIASRVAARYITAAGGGAIISTSSIAARHGGSIGAGLYGSAKAFISNFTRNMARELAPHGIRVNAVSPGVIMTPFHEQFSTAEFLDSTRKTIPMQRLGTVEDCVGAYLFLASDNMSGYITGQVIEVNGGQLMPS